MVSIDVIQGPGGPRAPFAAFSPVPRALTDRAGPFFPLTPPRPFSWTSPLLPTASPVDTRAIAVRWRGRCAVAWTREDGGRAPVLGFAHTGPWRFHPQMWGSLFATQESRPPTTRMTLH